MILLLFFNVNESHYPYFLIRCWLQLLTTDEQFSYCKVYALWPTSCLTLGWLTFPHPVLHTTQTDKLIAKSWERHKFWDFEAQLAQIEHKFFDPCLTPFPTLGRLQKWNLAIIDVRLLCTHVRISL